MRTQPRYLLLAGAVAGVTGIAVSHLATTLLNVRATPIQALAELIIAKTPGPIAETLIQIVGRKDKPILVAGVTTGVIVLGALAGLVARRSRLGANLVFLLMGLIGLVALMSGPAFTASTLLPLVLGVAAWLISFAFLVDAAVSVSVTGVAPDDVTGVAAADAGVVDAGESRRSFLMKAGVVALVSVAVTAGAEVLGRGRRAVETSRRLLRLPVALGTSPDDASLGVPGVEPWRTSNDEFYRIDTALVLPAVDPIDWKLRVHGMVDRELTLTYQDLLDRRLTEEWITLCCVSNPVGGDLISNAFWSGIRIADVLAEAGVSPRADAVLQTSHDGWTCGTPIEALTDGRNAMLAVAMNGEPLPVEHGFPVRMVVPGLYGYVSATKWLVDLEVTRFERISAYWTRRGWSEKGPVKTESKIERPGNGEEVKAGPLRVGGYAWAQHTGIAAVEVRLDGNAWTPAELGGVPGRDTWVQWAAAVDVDPGNHTVAVRATDKSGYTQTAAQAGVIPDGATGWHTVEFSAG